MSAVIESQPQRVRRYRAPPGQLTARETEMFHLLARGLSTKQISAEMKISQRTAEIHRSRMMEKLAVFTPAQAGVEYARRYPELCGLEDPQLRPDLAAALHAAGHAIGLLDSGSTELARAAIGLVESLVRRHVKGQG